ncbi:MAG TPA: PEP-CTERM sorting domain-containing protein [Verrucomicrobiae bacterium]|nr:PEP-CTERM sorting domain-containing protein [Verrucomicrobiae bacterium]
MKKLITAALLLGGVILASQSAFGQFIGNDLYMGFQNSAGGAASDYIINFGAASGIVGSSSVVDLSSDFSLSDFNSVLGTSSSMFAGVVGGSNGNPPDLYVTQLRSGGAGTPSVAGSTSPATFYKGDLLVGYSDLSQLTLAAPPAGAGVLDSSKAWVNYVEPTFTVGTFYGDTGINPDSSVSPSTVVYEDLWYDSNSSSSVKQPFTYEGYFTLDLTGGNPSLTFTPAAVPEPATLGLLGGAGLLLLAFRRRLGGKNA